MSKLGGVESWRSQVTATLRPADADSSSNTTRPDQGSPVNCLEPIGSIEDDTQWQVVIPGKRMSTTQSIVRPPTNAREARRSMYGIVWMDVRVGRRGRKCKCHLAILISRQCRTLSLLVCPLDLINPVSPAWMSTGGLTPGLVH